MVQGEKFRPHKLEAIVDDMLQLFLSSISSIQLAELSVVKRQVLSDLTEFSTSLQEVAGKYYDGLEDKLLEKDERSYEEIVADVNQISLRDFAEEFLIRKTRRLTIELFAGKLKKKEREYRLLGNFNLGQREYTLAKLEDLAATESITIN